MYDMRLPLTQCFEKVRIQTISSIKKSRVLNPFHFSEVSQKHSHSFSNKLLKLSCLV